MHDGGGARAGGGGRSGRAHRPGKGDAGRCVCFYLGRRHAAFEQLLAVSAGAGGKRRAAGALSERGGVDVFRGGQPPGSGGGVRRYPSIVEGRRLVGGIVAAGSFAGKPTGAAGGDFCGVEERDSPAGRARRHAIPHRRRPWRTLAGRGEGESDHAVADGARGGGEERGNVADGYEGSADGDGAAGGVDGGAGRGPGGFLSYLLSLGRVSPLGRAAQCAGESGVV